MKKKWSIKDFKSGKCTIRFDFKLNMIKDLINFLIKHNLPNHCIEQLKVSLLNKKNTILIKYNKNKDQISVFTMNSTWPIFDFSDVFEHDQHTELDVIITKINTFFTKEGLDSAVIGVSGGIDSAVVLNLLSKAANVPNSPIKKIMALSLPIFCEGTSDQDLAEEYACLSSPKAGKKGVLVFKTIDLSTVARAYIQLNQKTTKWAIGQLASIVRTPQLYYTAAQLQADGYKSIVVGTMNKCERELGFYGKASDAMVDLQPIQHLLKSEVYQLAKKLGINQKIINRPPTGDVWNNEIDEQTFGQSYKQVENWILGARNTKLDRFKKRHSHKFKVGLPSRTL